MEVYNGVGFYVSDRKSDSFLEVNSCGYTAAGARDTDISRPDGRRDYQLMYVDSGVLRIYENGRETELGPGNAVIYRPGDAQIYSHLAGRNTLVYWVHFSGTAAEDILRQAGFSGRVKFVGQAPRTAGHIAGMLGELHLKRPMAGVCCAARLIDLIVSLARCEGADDGDGGRGRSRFENVLARLDLHCEDNHPLNELAASCGMSKYHFIREFKQATGFSPHAYLTNVRLEKAEYLLRSTALSVGEIAAMIGYDNQFYFSRIFSQRVGMSPTRFRKSG